MSSEWITKRPQRTREGTNVEWAGSELTTLNPLLNALVLVIDNQERKADNRPYAQQNKLYLETTYFKTCVTKMQIHILRSV